MVTHQIKVMFENVFTILCPVRGILLGLVRLVCSVDDHRCRRRRRFAQAASAAPG